MVFQLSRVLLAGWLLAQPTFALKRTEATGGVTPVQKVITLLGELEEQITEEGKAEAVEYDRFACFCKEQSNFKQYAIEKSDAKIESLTATIDSLESDINVLSGEMSELGVRIEAISGEVDVETNSSSVAQATYVAQADNLTTAIKATEDAIAALKASKEELQGGAKLALVTKAMANAPIAAALLASKLANSQSPASYTYNSNEIIGILQDLLVTFKQGKKDLDTTEIDRQGASQKKLLALSNEKKFKTQAKAEKEKLVGSKTEAKSAAEADRTSETNARDADKEFQDELTTTCEGKATEFDQRSKARTDELTAISEAKEALTTGVEPNYNANKKLVGIQRHSVVSRGAVPMLLQLKKNSGAASAAEVARRAIELLDGEAKKLQSPKLAAVAAKMSVQEDHFVKVRGLISDLISKLEAEAESEATSKSLCDTEMKKAVTARDAQKLNIEKESTVISQKEALKAQLTQEIATLAKEIADLNKALSEATQLRAAEKANNEKTIADAGKGEESIKLAISVLEKFYAPSLTQINSTAPNYTAYAAPNSDREGQTVKDRAPEMSYSGDYRGKTEASSGIIGLLQVILSDFERTSSTVTSEEEAAAKEHAEFETDTTASINAKDDEKTKKEGEVIVAEDAIIAAQGELKDATALHEDSLAELEKLNAMCVEGEESWEERKAQREKEIEALKEALKILEEWKA